MSTVTANGFPVIALEMRMPLTGIWSGEISIQTDKDIKGPVTIKIENGMSFTGVSIRSAVWLGKVNARIVGGKGGLSNIVECKSYNQISASIIVKDILSLTGETLSSKSSPLSDRIDWVRIKSTAGSQLDLLTKSLGYNWRFLIDGTLWIGKETWPAAPKIKFDKMDEMANIAWKLYCSDTFFVLPGMTFDSSKAHYVLHLIDSKKMRTEVFSQYMAAGTGPLSKSNSDIISTKAAIVANAVTIADKASVANATNASNTALNSPDRAFVMASTTIMAAVATCEQMNRLPTDEIIHIFGQLLKIQFSLSTTVAITQSIAPFGSILTGSTGSLRSGVVAPFGLLAGKTLLDTFIGIKVSGYLSFTQYSMMKANVRGFTDTDFLRHVNTSSNNKFLHIEECFGTSGVSFNYALPSILGTINEIARRKGTSGVRGSAGVQTFSPKSFLQVSVGTKIGPNPNNISNNLVGLRLHI